MAVFGDFLLGCSAAGILVCAAYAVFPWTLYLGIREVPAASWAVLSGRDNRRRLRFVLKGRRDADREILASLPHGEPYIVLLGRWGCTVLVTAWLRVTGIWHSWLTLEYLDRSFSLRSRALPEPASRTYLCAGCEALLAREAHERYEAGFHG